MAEQMKQEAAGKTIPAGYKQTEVGVIPEDWVVSQIGVIADVIRGASPRPKGDKRFYGGCIPRLMVEDVTRDGKYVTPAVDSLTEMGAKLSRPCLAGTLTIVCSGTVGVPSILAVDACIHDGFLGLNKVNKNISVDYLFHFFSTQKEKFNNSATHGGVFTNLTTDAVKNFLIAMPGNKQEQTAIANVLSDSDALIDALEQLIAKKQAIKSATMQQLLTGRTRLPAFALRPDGTKKGYKPSELGDIPEDWAITNIGSQCTIFGRIGFRGYTKEDIVGEEDGVISLSPSNIKNGKLTYNGCTYITWEKYEESPEIKIYNNDILLVKTGSTFGKIGIVKNLPKEATLNPQIVVLKKLKCHYGFLGAMMGFNIVQDQINESIVGGAIPTLSQKEVSNFLIPLPTIEEQTAIATILSDMDNELQALTQKLEKARALKQGMMQQLLTGKIRLPLAAGA
ncbi:restriction endonuclease subunit S [Aeromonas dhakensis]|uniref:restriction endonuclease subunit S n=1 Tax=Aeromonas dhakensis TaxID=196024 RepID=UPI0038D0CD1F